MRTRGGVPQVKPGRKMNQDRWEKAFHLRFADDVVLLTESEEQLKEDLKSIMTKQNKKQ